MHTKINEFNCTNLILRLRMSKLELHIWCTGRRAWFVEQVRVTKGTTAATGRRRRRCRRRRRPITTISRWCRLRSLSLPTSRQQRHENVKPTTPAGLCITSVLVQENVVKSSKNAKQGYVFGFWKTQENVKNEGPLNEFSWAVLGCYFTRAVRPNWKVKKCRWTQITVLS